MIKMPIRKAFITCSLALLASTPRVASALSINFEEYTKGKMHIEDQMTSSSLLELCKPKTPNKAYFYIPRYLKKTALGRHLRRMNSHRFMLAAQGVPGHRSHHESAVILFPIFPEKPDHGPHTPLSPPTPAPAPVPEPSTLALLATGALSLAFFKRKLGNNSQKNLG